MQTLNQCKIGGNDFGGAPQRRLGADAYAPLKCIEYYLLPDIPKSEQREAQKKETGRALNIDHDGAGTAVEMSALPARRTEDTG